MRLLSAIAAMVLLQRASALFFYLEGDKPRCFMEELPRDTVVSGEFSTQVLENGAWKPDPELEVKITVEVAFARGRPGG